MIRIAQNVLCCGKQEVLPMAKRKNKKIIVKRNRLKGNTATANRKYKDTVFRMLFSDRKNLLSLYNGINETSYTCLLYTSPSPRDTR